MPFTTLHKQFKSSRLCPGDDAWIAGWLIHMLSKGAFQHSNCMKDIHKCKTVSKSGIEFLPIINNSPDNYSTIYTTLVECLKNAKSTPVIVTFDFPLWIKAVRIVIERDLPIIVRLGGFHLLKSYLGCIGYIMKDSGLETLMQLIYPGNVDHIADGNAFYKALRAHFLIDAAYCCHALGEYYGDEDLNEIRQFIHQSKESKWGSQHTSDDLKIFSEKLSVKFKLSQISRTSALWVQYHEMVSTIKSFIRAERLHDWNLHLAVTTDMLWTFAAAGHGQYAKGDRLYLELMELYSVRNKSVFDIFKVEGLHTVRYSNFEWSGIWTDMCL